MWFQMCLNELGNALYWTSSTLTGYNAQMSKLKIFTGIPKNITEQN